MAKNYILFVSLSRPINITDLLLILINPVSLHFSLLFIYMLSFSINYLSSHFWPYNFFFTFITIILLHFLRMILFHSFLSTVFI